MKYVLDRDSVPTIGFFLSLESAVLAYTCACLLCYLFPAPSIWFECWGHGLCQGALLFGLVPRTVSCSRQTPDPACESGRLVWTAHAVVRAVSIWRQEARVMLSKEMSCKCFSFSLWGEVKSVLARFCLLGDTKYASAVSFGIFVCFVWSHPCWYLNTIGKQMANFELLDQIRVCLCLLNSQTVNYRA